MTEDQSHWTTPPHVDDGLAWYFGQAESDMGVRSISEAMEAMALAGINGGGTVQTDDKLVRRRIVGLSTTDRGDVDIRLDHLAKGDGGLRAGRDRESFAGKFRRIDGYLRQMSRLDYAVLALAYGGPDALHGQVKDIVSTPQFRKLFGAHAAVALLTTRARSMPVVDFDRWARSKETTPAALTAVKLEALAMLRGAYGRFADLRGRRTRRLPDHETREAMFRAAARRTRGE